MRNQTYRAACTHNVLENFKDAIQCSAVILCIETSESFIDKDRVRPNRCLAAPSPCVDQIRFSFGLRSARISQAGLSVDEFLFPVADRTRDLRTCML